MSSLATLTAAGRAAIVLAIKSQPLHLAWGSGDPAWSADENKAHLKEILTNKESLENELGRRQVAVSSFVLPDSDGDIVLPTGRQSDGTVQQSRFRQVEGPTPHLFVRVNFDYEEAENQIVREVAVFMNTVVKPELPPGQRYFKPDEILNFGQMLSVQRLDPVLNRSSATRESFEFVLSI